MNTKKKHCNSSKKIILDGMQIIYSLRESSRARALRITIVAGGQVRVTKPRFLSDQAAQEFLLKKSRWITKHIKSQLIRLPSPLQGIGKREYKKLKRFALNLIKEKISQFNASYNFPVRRVFVRNQKTRWGSCSKNGNLNFNFRVALLPENLLDYVVAHELCHLREPNHSPRFWNLVGTVLPDYVQLRQSLKAHRL